MYKRKEENSIPNILLLAFMAMYYCAVIILGSSFLGEGVPAYLLEILLPQLLILVFLIRRVRRTYEFYRNALSDLLKDVKDVIVLNRVSRYAAYINPGIWRLKSQGIHPDRAGPCYVFE